MAKRRFYKRFGLERIEDNKFKDIKRQVKKRDKCICGLCDKYRKGGEVHHIRRWADAPRLRYEERNLIWVCYKCHYKKIKNNEDAYVAILLEKVRQRYE